MDLYEIWRMLLILRLEFTVDKNSLSDCRDFEKKNNYMSFYGLRHRNKTFYWKKIKMSMEMSMEKCFFEKVIKQEKCHFRHCI